MPLDWEGVPADHRQQIEGFLEEYRESYRSRNVLSEVVACRTSDHPAGQRFTSMVPIYGPIENPRNPRVHMDDGPHVRQLAEFHARAVQLAAIFGNVQGYDGDSLARQARRVMEGVAGLETSAGLEALSDAVAHAGNGIEKVVVAGSAKNLGALRRVSMRRGRMVASPDELQWEFLDPSGLVQIALIPLAPLGTLVVAPLQAHVAEAVCWPPVGEVEFDNLHLRDALRGNHYAVRAVAYHDLKVHNPSRVVRLELAQPGV